MSELAVLTEQLRRTRRALDRQIGEAEALARRGIQTQAEVARLTAEVEDNTRAATVLTSIGEQRQAQAQAQIETLVTKGLQTIFDEELTFHLVPVVRGSRPEIDFTVRSTLDGGTVDTPVLDSRGGGLAAIVGILLRVVVLLLTPDRQAPILILDETAAHVSAEYETRLAEFLRELVDKTDAQVIIVTHSDAFSDLADTRYRFRLDHGITQVEPL